LSVAIWSPLPPPSPGLVQSAVLLVAFENREKPLNISLMDRKSLFL